MQAPLPMLMPVRVRWLLPCSIKREVALRVIAHVKGQRSVRVCSVECHLIICRSLNGVFVEFCGNCIMAALPCRCRRLRGVGVAKSTMTSCPFLAVDLGVADDIVPFTQIEPLEYVL